MIYAITLASFFLSASGITGTASSTHMPVSDRYMDSAVREQPAPTTVDPDELIAFAETFLGVPYKYASADPVRGFDCSGFVSYVFTHFQVSVPRSSSAFARIGTQVSLADAQPGDIILFTSPRGTERKVGHVGIVTKGGEKLSFIHASSGKVYSVTEGTMTPHYKQRFIKVVRVL